MEDITLMINPLAHRDDAFTQVFMAPTRLHSKFDYFIKFTLPDDVTIEDGMRSSLASF